MMEGLTYLLEQQALFVGVGERCKRYLFEQQALFIRHLLEVPDVVVYFLRVLALLPFRRLQLVLQLPL